MRSRTWVAAVLSGSLAVATVVASVGVGTAATSGTAAKWASHSRTALAPCMGADLKVTLGRSEGTAGTSYQRIHVANTGSQACTVSGYPRVSFRNAAGRPVGLPSLHQNFTGVPIRVITIEPGRLAHTDVAIPDAFNFPRHACKPQDTRRLRFTPPHRSLSHVFAYRTTICTTENGRTMVGPMRRGRGQ